MSEKAKRIAEIQALIPKRWTPPKLEATQSDLTLLEVGLLCVLTRDLSGSAAEKTLTSLRTAYPDWNELRVSQVQEYQGLVKSRSADLQRKVAHEVKEYLQEVFQKNHGFDLEFLREDPAEAGKFVLQLPHLGASAGHFLLWLASGGQVPASAGTIRVLDRLGLMKRTSSVRKAAEALDQVVPPEGRQQFGVDFGLVIENWCDAKKPICWECVLVEECRYGKKVFKDWKTQQKRLEVQRKREEERRRKEEERARKRAEAEAKKRAREEARQAREEERRKKREAKKREAEKLAAARRAAKEKAARTAAKKKKKKPTTRKKTKTGTRSGGTKSNKKTGRKKTTRRPTTRKGGTGKKKKTTKRR